MGDCWVLTDFVVPGLIGVGFIGMSVVAFATLADNSLLLRMQFQRESLESIHPNNGEVEPERVDIPNS